MNTHAQVDPPRLLLVEDDATSQGFFRAALEALPAAVDVAGSVAQALQMGSATRHHLWLVDAHLPDGSGQALLQRLRALHPQVPALAHTADNGAGVRQSLHAAGFERVLVKPMTRAELLAAVRDCLGQAAAGHAPAGEDAVAPDWDESAALSALNGQQAHVVALRELFLSELPVARDAVSVALRQHDDGALRRQLHRLQASCGFVGASRLGRAVRQLHQAPESDMARRQFDAAVSALLH
ncbi:Hpt domain-containing response regulator [Stenotrophomonas acidaminiphila]|jgi:CheY-like chemotaxis protein|uniref:Two component regulator response regulator transcriptional regulator n=1 Tax=Stenotrophomonas acidaminiphila TaxID=128780 RepID=A0A0R0DR08_9GAMM|nr:MULTISPECIES: response regulator [Stenotrophomonas]ALJ27697.1 two component regulator response regulator transcriptional regulator [Stenotrophomonas acidaminiphila]KRG84553.1 transcriptional regulator [Stenotrophomonas acidaminiphila]QOF99637.1 response regulator [Stenotrophomonas sp. CW117]